MIRKDKKILYQFLVCLVPLLTFFSPSWFSIGGVSPRWGELWLLPWAIEEGPLRGLFAGFCIGILLDSINLGVSSQIPSLMLLGCFWGLVGSKRKYTDNIFQLGLLAWSGSISSGICLWFQELFLVKDGIGFHAWAFHTVIAGAILNGLIAPLFCSMILRTFFSRKI